MLLRLIFLGFLGDNLLAVKYKGGTHQVEGKGGKNNILLNLEN